jgi:hypothetical protein
MEEVILPPQINFLAELGHQPPKSFASHVIRGISHIALAAWWPDQVPVAGKTLDEIK